MSKGEQMAEWGAVVVAAGRGTRMGTTESKQYLALGDKPILVHTLENLQRFESLRTIVLVVGKDDVERCTEWVESYQLHKVAKVVEGGIDRQDTVWLGLQEISEDWVLVHDGVRPFISQKALEACCIGAQQAAGEAAVVAVPVKDTIKQVDSDGVIVATPDRSKLWAVQTPQAFRRSRLVEAHLQAQASGLLGTDDAMLVEQAGGEVVVVEGDYSNIKITTPEDLDYAAWLLERLM